MLMAILIINHLLKLLGLLKKGRGEKIRNPNKYLAGNWWKAG
jgi:hypothetical protein